MLYRAEPENASSANLHPYKDLLLNLRTLHELRALTESVMCRSTIISTVKRIAFWWASIPTNIIHGNFTAVRLLTGRNFSTMLCKPSRLATTLICTVRRLRHAFGGQGLLLS